MTWKEVAQAHASATQEGVLRKTEYRSVKKLHSCTFIMLKPSFSFWIKKKE